MSTMPQSAPCSLWHDSAEAKALLAQLGPNDVRLTFVRACPGPDRLEWHPDGDYGAAVFAALAALRQRSVGPAFALACDDAARMIALAAAQRAPTVSAAVAGRFPDPARWLGHGAVEATRRFRAHWT
jgi:hypothetical protein